MGVSLQGILSSTIVKSGYTAEPMLLGSVSILGVEVAPTSINLNGQTLPPSDYQYRNKVNQV